VLNGYRLRLYPSPAQAQILLRWIGCQRLIYNAKVQEDRYFRRFARRMVGTAGAPVPVDQQYRQFITDKTPFLKQVPSQILRNGAVQFRQAYARCFQQLGGRPKFKQKSGRQAVWLTAELFQFRPQIDEQTGAGASYQLHIGTKKFPVGLIPYVAHRSHALPSSIHIAVDGGHWWLAFAAEDPEVTMLAHTVNGAMERIADDLRHLSDDQLVERTLGGDRGVAKPLMTSDGPPMARSLISARCRKTGSRRRAANRTNGSGGRRDAKKDRRTSTKPTDKRPAISGTTRTCAMSTPIKPAMHSWSTRPMTCTCLRIGAFSR